MILETIVTTLDRQGQVNAAPMGVTPRGAQVILRPFTATTTFRNLREVPSAVVNLVDDAALYAYTALGDYRPDWRPAEKVIGAVLTGACSWMEVEADDVVAVGERAVISCRVVHQGRLRDFLGFCRARNAVIEATILATRLHLTPPPEVEAELVRLQTIVDKCGDGREREAMHYVTEYVRSYGRGNHEPGHAG
jgi:hypothetical protein